MPYSYNNANTKTNTDQFFFIQEQFYGLKDGVRK